MSSQLEGGGPAGAAPSAAQEPLAIFVALHRRMPSRSRGPRFNAGEHAWLGSIGAKAACVNLKANRNIIVDPTLFDTIWRRDRKESLQYGELVALSGDFYESPEALFDEKPSPFHWLWENNDLSDIRKIFEEELRWIEARRQGGGDTKYPDENVRLAWNAKSYVELALRNTDHFGWHNLIAYCRHHATALELAAKARGREDDNFRQAQYTNAFADHFLTDGFAAGHIRVPRAEIRAWADACGLSEKIAGSLSKLLHDQDGHVNLGSLHGQTETNRSENDGLRVQNAAGDVWNTYCDGQLFLETSTGRPAVDHAVTAVSASVTELLLAWQLRELPRKSYAATRFVPFPHPDAPALVDKFPSAIPDEALDCLWKSVAWYSKIPWIAGLERDHIRGLFEALPQIMADFRANVALAATDATLKERLNPRYIAAYCKVA